MDLAGDSSPPMARTWAESSEVDMKRTISEYTVRIQPATIISFDDNDYNGPIITTTTVFSTSGVVQREWTRRPDHYTRLVSVNLNVVVPGLQTRSWLLKDGGVKGSLLGAKYGLLDESRVLTAYDCAVAEAYGKHNTVFSSVFLFQPALQQGTLQARTLPELGAIVIWAGFEGGCGVVTAYDPDSSSDTTSSRLLEVGDVVYHM
ncbi:hypothetical protein EDD18DRAFT_1364563 [Armillaria luteobubalina]|uniref:Uncharacterized protein n=1 Tax=Armillaria luteobubalina TaxID=153913 RepID=A0AA39UH55_9AGAR|nr:hypothetical protein EDD18DRAFT_1364563 [Armillaria luteobubalina]